MRIDIPGIPEEVGEQIEFPSDLELLEQPLFNATPLDYFMKHATDFQKMIVSKMPLKHKAKNAYVSCLTRTCVPGFLINRIVLPHRGSTRNEWHVDGILDPNRTVHAVSNILGTEFNVKPFSLELPEGESEDWVMKEVLKIDQEQGIEPWVSPAGRIVSWSNHLHRAPLPTHKAIRFFMRIQETDHDFNVPEDRMKQTGTSIWKGTTQYRSIEQLNGKVVVHFPDTL